MKVKQWESVYVFFLKINPSRTLLMKSSRRELSIDMVIQSGIFINNQITLFPCFTFISKTGVSFNSVQGFILRLFMTVGDVYGSR